MDDSKAGEPGIGHKLLILYCILIVMVLAILKVSGQFNWSWYMVFLPFTIYACVNILSAIAFVASEIIIEKITRR